MHWRAVVLTQLIKTMLHAFNIKHARRILERKGSEHSNEKSEDAATSMVFSPLAFMTPTEALACLCAVIGEPALKAVAGRQPSGHQVEMWPAGLTAVSANGEGMTRCEPDLMICFEFADEAPVVFIGEMKWGWPMPAAGLRIELDREIEAVKRLHPRHRQVVFVVSKYPYPVMTGVTSLTWRTFSSRIRSLCLNGGGTPAAIWADLVRQFLALADQFGFSGIPTHAMDPKWASATAFWRRS